MTVNSNKSYNNRQNEEENLLKISLVNQNVFIHKKRQCPLKDMPLAEINYKNLKLLNKFLTERGKIIPRRATNISMKKQKALAAAIKRARDIALLSPIKKDENFN